MHVSTFPQMDCIQKQSYQMLFFEIWRAADRTEWVTMNKDILKTFSEYNSFLKNYLKVEKHQIMQ